MRRYGQRGQANLFNKELDERQEGAREDSVADCDFQCWHKRTSGEAKRGTEERAFESVTIAYESYMCP